MVPGSALQMHQEAFLLADEEAAVGLERKDYYRYVFENKPEWQRL